MEFSFLTTTSNNFGIIAGMTTLGALVAVSIFTILAKIIKADAFKSFFVALFAFITIFSIGFWLSTIHKEVDVDKTQSLAQIEDQGVTIISTGDYIFDPIGSFWGEGWKSIDEENYIEDHLLQLRGDDGTDYSCRVVVPKINEDNIFFVDCLQTNSDTKEYVALDKVLKES